MDRHLLRGALLSENDIETARPVAVINQTLARDFFGQGDPIGQKINFKILDEIPQTPHGMYFEIIGIVSDAKNRGLRDPVMPEAFLPYTFSGFGDRGILVRTAVDPDSLLGGGPQRGPGGHRLAGKLPREVLLRAAPIWRGLARGLCGDWFDARGYRRIQRHGLYGVAPDT